MDEVVLVDVLHCAQQLLEETKVLLSVNLPPRCLQVSLQGLPRTVLHLDHEVNGNKLLVLLQIVNESIIIKAVIVFRVIVVLIK